MNANIVNMLEKIKSDNQLSYQNYLTEENIQEIQQWFSKFSINPYIDFEKIIGLMYKLYIKEDIDARPCEEYNSMVSTLADEYNFNPSDFLSLYQEFRKIVFGK